ncbi:hypoxanthine-guanine phosphoribosyltransferase [Clostridia bacterium]|nr:hypoxanthine-guanine phosphoribosyltransferase [Clostridia bacterium]
MKEYIDKILIDEETLNKRVNELALQINEDYKGKRLVMIGVLKGSFTFMADLLRRITLDDVEIDFMKVSSYGASTKSSGVVRIVQDLEINIEKAHLLIVEDILDTGKTLSYLIDLFESRSPASVKVCTILNKPSRREVNIEADYVGFDIPDEFVIGYGLDYAQKYRNLPFVGVLKKEFVL